MTYLLAFLAGSLVGVLAMTVIWLARGKRDTTWAYGEGYQAGQRSVMPDRLYPEHVADEDATGRAGSHV